MSPPAPDREIDRANGRFRSVVTYLEMLQPPGGAAPAPPHRGVDLRQWHEPDVDDYLALFHRVGDRWLWHGRLTRDRAAIADLVNAADYAVWRLWVDGEVAGLCELDRSRPGEVKIEYFGLVPEYIGHGLGGYFLRAMLHEAWRGEVRRVWLHTCTEDHPGALAVYQGAGFRPYHEEAEWIRDPRLVGLLPRDAGPHVPIAEP